MNLTFIALVSLGAAYVIIPVVFVLLAPRPFGPEDLKKRRRAIVLVLGDLSRSPRMNYHALSLANGGIEVNLCGYVDKDLFPEVVDHDLITIHEIPVVRNDKNLPFFLFAIWKVILQHYYLYKTLKPLKNAWYLIVQNPPSIPTLGVVKFFVTFISSRTKVIIDWHNLGFSILALKLGANHPYVKIARWYERFFGARAWVHLTVSVGLGQYLRQEFGMSGRRILPLHDRPAWKFSVMNKVEKKTVVMKHIDSFFKDLYPDEKRLITSTSYTPDENLQLLLDALEIYASKPAEDNLPRIRMIITGKGPMFPEMKAKIEKLQPSIEHRVKIFTVWLSQTDYARVIGTADVGVSLHESSSGWDLPMKIVDMFGAGVPAITMNFPAIKELVKNEENGVVLKENTKEAMADAIIHTLTTPEFLKQITAGAVRESRNTWNHQWNEVIGPLFGIGEYAVSTKYRTDEELSSSDED